MEYQMRTHIPFQGLVKANRPALVYIENENFKHFVVFRGFKKGNHPIKLCGRQLIDIMVKIFVIKRLGEIISKIFIHKQN
jgi:hypothetical protein